MAEPNSAHVRDIAGDCGIMWPRRCYGIAALPRAINVITGAAGIGRV